MIVATVKELKLEEYRVAGGGKVELALMKESEALQVTVVTSVDPYRAISFFAPSGDAANVLTIALAACRKRDLGRVGFGQCQCRVRCRGAQCRRPSGFFDGTGAAIDDQAFLADAEFER